MMRKFTLLAALLIAGIAQAQQTTLLDEVHTVAASGEAVPVEFGIDIVGSGNYDVTLTDLGAPTVPGDTGTPLAAVRLAVTRDATVIGTSLTEPGTLSFAATANTHYVIRVTGKPGALGSGLFRVDVRSSGASTALSSFVDILAPPPGEPATGQFVLDTPLSVPSTGNYDVSLHDLLLPARLPQLLLAVVEEGGPLIVPLATSSTNSSVSQTVTLESTRQYRIFSIAVPATPISGGLYGFDVSAAGGGASALSRTVPVGGAVLLGSINLAGGAHTLTLHDLAFPEALAATVVDVVKGGQLVQQATAVGDVAFTAAAGPHDVYAFGAPASNALGGSLSAAIAPTGAASVFSGAHVFAAAGGPVAYSYDATIANAAAFRVRLADYQFPAAFQTLRLAAVQNGAVLGTPLTAAGSIDVNAAQGKLSLLALARGDSSGSLFGVDVTPTALGAVAFETTQGVGGTFIARKLSVNSTMSFDVRVSDLMFPARFTNLSTAVTRGSDRIGLTFGGGTFSFDATPGNYFLNIIALPDATEGAGTYAAAVTQRPPPPVVTLTASPDRLTSSGGAVDLTWSTQAATGCTASGGWSGSKAASGTERSAVITAATKFTLACTGAGGTTTKDLTVSVIADPPAKGGGGGAFEAAWLWLLALCATASLLLRAPRTFNSGALAPAMVAMLSLLALSGCGGAQSRYARSMERGAQFLQAGDFDKARVEFRNATQISPKSAEARYQVGVVAQRRADFREALVSYKTAIDLQPDYPDAQAAMARIYLLAGSPDRALEIIAPAIAKHPDNVALLVARGASYVQLKKPQEAHADAERAVKLAPADESAATLMASLLRAGGDTPAAVALLKSTLERAPESIDLRRVLATMLIETGDLKGAEAQLVAAVKTRPEDLPLRYELANFYSRNHNLDAAQQTLEAAVAQSPKNDDAKLVLANFLAANRSREAGEKKLRAMIAAEPDNLDLRLGLAGLLEHNRADPEAIKAYEEIIARDTTSPKALTARNRLVSYYATHGDLARAESLIAEIIKLNPRDTDALAMRARIAIDKGNAGAAVVDLRTVLRDVPNSPVVYRELARAHLANGDVALAEDALRKSLELAPTDSAVRVELAQLLIRTGRADASVSMLEDAVRKNPNDATVREALVRAYVETRDLAAAARAAEDLQVLLPRSPSGFYLRGQVAQLQKDPAEAEKQFLLALGVEPDAIDALAALCKQQVAAGRGSEAIKRVEDTIAAGDAPALQNLHGELLLATGDFQKAVVAFEQTIKEAPRWWLPYRNLAIARYSLKDVAGATRTYEEGIKHLPNDVALVVDLAALYELQKRYDDAIRVYETFHAAHPDSDLATNNLAKALLAHRSDAPSLARAAKLTEPFAHSPDPALLDTYGWSLYRSGDYLRAQQVLESAFARAQDSGSIRYHLALVQVQSGQLDKAISNLEVAVNNPRGFVGIAEARTLLQDLKSRAS
jgi:tetratricopeptide (TPR) repeat protein